ncbi:hemolysin family protein [Clostridium sp.]|jgi:putative hemolysin|uniref:hemolysin family protein n=1 Tax=Clostridium sp. TaxID=1506 RepID=UPI00258828C9|nr:hemolysin family protein [Clostridium sp.]MDF2503972.1 HlyC/CorC family protein [Clostridium sp.]
MESGPAPEPNGSIISQFILIAILTLINAFFAASEMAIVSLNKNKIKLLAQEGNRKAKLLEKLIEEPTKFLSTIQVGITLAGFFSSASAATGISNRFSRFLINLNIPYSEAIALVVITIGLSYITLVFGELFPKRIALQKSEAIAMFSVVPILFLSKVVNPFIKILSISTNMLVHVTGMDRDRLEEKVSKDEIKSLIETGQRQGIINETEKEMIDSIFKSENKLAKEIMTPRTEVFLIDINESVNKFLDKLLEKKYSRIPVYEGDTDNIIGILNIKDFLIEARKKGFEDVDIKSILHVPYFVYERKNINELFKELKSSRNQMSILIDEYGGFSGVVTIKDLVEEVMGNIEDEYDNDEPDIRKVDNNTYIVNGLLPLHELNEHLHLNLVSKTYDTIGGFLISLMGRIPKKNEAKSIEYENIIFQIEEVKKRRIERVKICI